MAAAEAPGKERDWGRVCLGGWTVGRGFGWGWTVVDVALWWWGEPVPEVRADRNVTNLLELLALAAAACLAASQGLPTAAGASSTVVAAVLG